MKPDEFAGQGGTFEIRDGKRVRVEEHSALPEKTDAQPPARAEEQAAQDDSLRSASPATSRPRRTAATD